MPTDYSGAGSIHALLARFTKLDESGAPSQAADNILWTDSLVKVSLGVNLNEPDPVRQTNGAGVTCLLYQAPKTIDSLNVDSFSFCTPDPRIAEFLAGGDVIVDGTSEVQQIAITGGPTSGSFTLSNGTDTTNPIAYNATTAQLVTALNAIIAGGVTAVGGPLPASPIVVTFKKKVDVAMLVADSTLLVGGTGAAVEVTTVTEGGPNTTPAKAIGYAAPQVGIAGKPNGVGVELWSRAIVGGGQIGYFHWLLPRLSLIISSDGFELGAEDPLTPTFTGSGSENPNYAAGADGLWPYISDRVYQWVQEDTLPTYTNGYASLVTP
jgi:hypothetical protein